MEIAMSTASIANGKTRKTLAEQLDRLDGILDALSEGLNEAVSDAVRDGTRSAVRDAIVEVLTNPELRALLGGVVPKPPAAESASAREPVDAKPTMLARVADYVREVAQRVAQRINSAVQTIRRAPRAALGLARSLGVAWKLKRILLIALGVGVVTAVVSSMGSHGFAAVVSGIGGAISAVAVQLGLWTRRLLRLPTS
jgi:hypothetical protein